MKYEFFTDLRIFYKILKLFQKVEKIAILSRYTYFINLTKSFRIFYLFLGGILKKK